VKVILTALMLTLSTGAVAEECAVRTEQGLAELSLVFPAMDEVQAAEAERILGEMCLGGGTSLPPGEPDTPSVMGIELNKAEADSKGHSRLKKSH
jgi:hypothetical protein